MPSNQVFAPSVLVGLAVFLFTNLSFAQNKLEVRDVSREGDQLTIIVQDNGSNSTSYQLQSSPDLNSTWTSATAQIVKSGNQITVTTDFTSEDRRFYRLLGFAGTTDDLDGDGLSNTFEIEVSGTDPELFDSDGDLFGDGAEYINGTDPNNIGDVPESFSLPAVEFAESFSNTTEGAGTYQIAVKVEGSFTGTLPVRWSVNPLSTAEAPGDLTSPSSRFDPANFQGTTEVINLIGGSGTIEINLVDDLAVAPRQRLLVLDIQPDPTATPTYRPGGKTTHVVVLNDNDCYFAGVLKDDLTERNFRLCQLRREASNETQTAFVAGEDSDGSFKLGLDWPQWGNVPTPYKVGYAVTNNGEAYRCTTEHQWAFPSEPGSGANWQDFWKLQLATSQTEGVIPIINNKSIWQATSTISDTRFLVESADEETQAERMPAPTAGFITKNLNLWRKLTLDADTSNPEHIISPNMIVGEYTEEIEPTNTPSVLTRTMTGTFALMKVIPAPPEVTNTLDPNGP